MVNNLHPFHESGHIQPIYRRKNRVIFLNKKKLVTERSVVYVVPFFIMIRIHVLIKVTV